MSRNNQLLVGRKVLGKVLRVCGIRRRLPDISDTPDPPHVKSFPDVL